MPHRDQLRHPVTGGAVVRGEPALQLGRLAAPAWLRERHEPLRPFGRYADSRMPCASRIPSIAEPSTGHPLSGATNRNQRMSPRESRKLGLAVLLERALGALLRPLVLT
jgi:hypothetical protein